MQVLSTAIDHAFIRLGFTSATDIQKEVLSEFVDDVIIVVNLHCDWSQE